MSFSFDGPSFRPMIQEPQSMKNNGGGGNTGYFKQGKKKKEKEEIEIFSDDDTDSFEYQEETEEKTTENKQANLSLLKSIINKTQKLVNNTLEQQKNPSNPFKPLSSYDKSE